jgi:hypothetical protein
MNKILSTKPKSTIKFHDETLTYGAIQKAIAENSTNRFLRGIVSMCKANPENVIVVVYRAYADSVMLVFGSGPTSVIVEGDDLQKNLSASSEKDYFYVFTHSK